MFEQPSTVHEQLATVHEQEIEWPDPTEDMLKTPEFETIWQAIKTWDINVPEAYDGYCGTSGNHVRHILDALAKVENESNT